MRQYARERAEASIALPWTNSILRKSNFIATSILLIFGCTDRSSSDLFFPSETLQVDLAVGERKEVEFPFTVQGSHELSIEHLIGTEGLHNLRIVLEEDSPWEMGLPLAPGQQGRVLFDIEGKSDAESEYSPQAKTAQIVIHHSGRYSPTILELQAQVLSYFSYEFENQHFPLTVMRGMNSASAEIVVRARQPFTIQSWNRLPLWLSIVGGRSHASEHRLIVTAAAHTPRGKHLLDCTAQTSIDATLKLSIPIRSVESIAIDPDNVIDLGIAQEESMPYELVKIQMPNSLVRIDQPPEISLSSPYFQWEPKSSGTRHRYDAVIVVARHTPVGRHEAKLRIELAISDYPVSFELPVKVEIVR